jgi:hypothetical protein
MLSHLRNFDYIFLNIGSPESRTVVSQRSSAQKRVLVLQRRRATCRLTKNNAHSPSHTPTCCILLALPMTTLYLAFISPAYDHPISCPPFHPILIRLPCRRPKPYHNSAHTKYVSCTNLSTTSSRSCTCPITNHN